MWRAGRYARVIVLLANAKKLHFRRKNITARAVKRRLLVTIFPIFNLFWAFSWLVNVSWGRERAALIDK